MFRFATILTAGALGAVLFAAAAPAEPPQSAPHQSATAAPTRLAPLQLADEEHVQYCNRWRSELQARIDQHNRNCYGVTDPNQAARCEQERDRLQSEQDRYNSQCGG